ncbi:MAG: hypothetical protein R3B11_11115 [Nitrospira sp.]|nr:hypothetical protein [Nitrospira sp.]MDR4476536.1 hypothetical protein [Nitrospira sp.]
MGRQYDHVDVMAAIGLVATLFGGYLLVTAADGFWQAPIAPRMHSTVDGTDAATGMQYLQPVLGQAIVQDLLLDQEAAATLSASTMELNRAVTESQAMATSLLSPLVLAELRAYGQETDHHARMQYVMGKSVVNQTRRGILSGILSAEPSAEEFNRNLIRTAESTGQRMHDEFVATRQATLGRSIVDAILDEDRMTAAAQERVGRAVVQVTQAQEGYAEAKAGRQIQLASAAVAAVRTDALMDRLARLEEMSKERTIVAHHRNASADVSRGLLILACVGLIVLFVGGLAFSSRKGEPEGIPLWKLDTLLHLHRSGR